MSLWVWTLLALLTLTTIAITLLALVHVRYEAAWFGMWTGDMSVPHEKFVRLDFGLPGFMHTWSWKGKAPGAAASEESSPRAARADRNPSRAYDQAPRHAKTSEKKTVREIAPDGLVSPLSSSTPNTPVSPTPPASKNSPRNDAGHPESSPPPHPKKDPHRKRKALFRFVTDGAAWSSLLVFAVSLLKRACRALNLRVEMTAGLPDPATLGRVAGYWYAVSPLLPLGATTMRFRFQDRHPSFGIRASGGFSMFSLIRFAVLVLLSFPFWTLGKRAWHGWRHAELAGWRAWTYRRIQTF